MSTKKTKRIISLILALTMVFTFMAMSASAANTEVQPRGTCPNCINGYIESEVTYLYEVRVNVTQCPLSNIPHTHTKKYYEITARCRNCGYVEVSYPVTTVCPHA